LSTLQTKKTGQGARRSAKEEIKEMIDIAANLITETWNVIRDMAPYLLFGFLAAGLLSVLIPAETVEKHLGGRGRVLPVLKAAVLGVPLPLCSCGVIPVAASFRRHGANRGATISFLISTPQTGVDSILVTLSLIGPVFAIFRPFAALITGLVGGIVTSFAGGIEETGSQEPCTDVCCTGAAHRSKLIRGLEYGFLHLPRDIAKSLLVGLVVAGAISAALPPDYFAALLGTGFGAMLVMMVIGIPIYVCATASVPIAAALIAKGISPGAAFVFLMTGPATNAATIATIWKILGKRALAVYLATVAVGALVCGAILDYIIVPAVPSVIAPMGGMLPEWVRVICGIGLLVLLCYAILTAGKAHADHQREQGDETSIAIKINGMSCSHCADAVRKALLETAGVSDAHVSLAKSEAVVRGKGLNPEALVRAVESLGYTAQPRNPSETEKGGQASNIQNHGRQQQ